MTPSLSHIAPRRRIDALLPIAAALLVTAAGCATRPDAGAGGASSTQTQDRLAQLAAQQASHPARRAMAAPTPPGVDAALLAPAPESDEFARQSLSEVVGRLANSAAGPSTPAHLKDDPAGPTAESIRLYISGRAKRLSGDTAGAIADFKAAAALDPSAMEPWRELGETNLQTGDRLAAVAAFREALGRDPQDLRSLEQVGLATLERRDAMGAAKLLATAWQVGEASEASYRHAVAMGLGKALHDLGYLSAGNEAFAFALDVPDRIDQPTVYMAEMGALYRERGDLWRDAGDAATRLGRFEEALQAYDRAAGYPTFDPGALAPRRVNACMRLGRPASAAQVVAGEITQARGRVEDRDLRLIEYLGKNSDVGPVLAQRIDEIESSLSDPERRLAAGRLARARAAALADEQARAVLRARLGVAPSDESALADLFARLDHSDPKAIEQETIRLVQAAPLEEQRYVAAMLRVQPSIGALLAAMPHAPGDAAASPAEILVRARLLDSSGDSAGAEGELRALMSRRPDFAPGVVALARMLTGDGRRDEATKLLETIDEHKDRDLRLAKAAALQATGDYEAALFTLTPSLTSAAGAGGSAEAGFRPSEALLAAELNLSLERWSQAEQWCRRALALDPTLEDAYAGLIGLYAPSGPLADSRRLGDVIRELRTALPSSRALRWLRAQDLVRSGQYDQAERELLSLAEEEPTQAVVETLVTVWLKTGSVSRAETWLREKMASRPSDGAPVVELARVLALSDRGEQAAKMLRDWLALRPSDAAASRRLEWVLRDSLKQISAADDLALRRLQASPPSVDSGLELTEILMRRGEPVKAMDALLVGIAASRTLRAEQTSALGKAAYQVGELAVAGKVDAPKALELCNAVIDIMPKAPLALHNTRLTLMARADPDVQRMFDALGLAAAQSPEAATDLALQASELLFRSGHPREALRVIERWARRGATTDERIMRKWIGLAIDENDRASAIASVKAAVDRGVVNRLADQPFETPAKGGAAVAFFIAGRFSQQEHDDDADELYRLALSYDPTHAMANNNLGFRMVERGERLQEATRLLEAAFAEEPDDMAIVDSLGWARYRTGVLEDEIGPEGGVKREGAVTLLERAAASPQGQDDPTVMDHLGDALWKAGRTEEAAKRWQAARALVGSRLAGPQDNPRDTRAMRALSKLLDEKILATAENREPPVTSILDAAADANAPGPTPAPARGASDAGKNGG